MRHDRPTIPDDLPPPWAVTMPDARLETLSEASKRLVLRPDRMRERALALGYWNGVVRDGETITLRADAWDRVASYRGKSGPKFDLHSRRAKMGRESATGGGCAPSGERERTPIAGAVSNGFSRREGARRVGCAGGGDGATVSDAINHPPHYAREAHEPIDVIESWGLGFHLGNVVKYIARAGKKGDAMEDLRKCQWYLNRYIEMMEKR